MGSPWTEPSSSLRASLFRHIARWSASRRSSEATHTSSTSIRFWVRVPVLSAQIQVTDPRLSTAARRRTRAWRAAIRRAPSASATVTTAGSASGIAATARLTATRNITRGASPRSTPIPKSTAQSTRIPIASRRPKAERRFWSGVIPGASAWSSRAMRPSSVSMAVAVTTPSPRP